ncbi:MAG: flagellin lysine-N-methylase [Lachnospiraceae bacterium]|nr:flagellin lysine-N-methylase [Lachnospiraceae bacterium]
MLYTIPDYYKQFHCLAGSCPATCCAGWQIVIDRKALQRYASLDGSFGNRVKNSVDWQEHTFLQYGKRCAFLNEDNLCDMHLEAGAEMMCATCRKYPRHIEVFDNEREISLSMSCPAVAKLILEKEEKVAFKTAQDDKCDPEDEAFDIFLYSVLQDTRSLLQSFLQNREESVFLRMQKVLALAHDVQNRINTRRIFEVETVLASYQKESVQRRLEGKLRSASGSRNVENIGLKADVANPIALFDLLDEFEVLDPQWQRDVLDWRELLTDTQETEEGCRNIRTFFSEDIIAQTEYEQMMVYYLYTYFCGAVYDGEALAKVKTAVFSTLIWAWSCCAKWLKQGNKIDGAERLELAWRYSRELEHSDMNLNKIDELAESVPQFSVESLIGHLNTLM